MAPLRAADGTPSKPRQARAPGSVPALVAGGAALLLSPVLGLLSPLLAVLATGRPANFARDLFWSQVVAASWGLPAVVLASYAVIHRVRTGEARPGLGLAATGVAMAVVGTLVAVVLATALVGGAGM